MAKEKKKETENKEVEVKETEAKQEAVEDTAEVSDIKKEDAPTEKKARATKTKGRGKKRKSARQVASGRAYIHASYNNTIVTLTDQNGNVLAWSSAGVVGFKGPKKSTPYAAGVIVRDAAEKARPTGLREVNVFVSGIGSGREAAVRSLHANGISVMTIKDVTPIPHNGCRPPKPRRI